MPDLHWIETLDLSAPVACKGLKPDQAVELEKAMYESAMVSVKEGYKRLGALGVPASRRPDFLAEMVKTDNQMNKVRAKVVESQQRIEAVEKRKKIQFDRKFSKQVRVAKQNEKSKLKEKNMGEIEALKEKARSKGFSRGSRQDSVRDYKQNSNKSTKGNFKSKSSKQGKSDKFSQSKGRSGHAGKGRSGGGFKKGGGSSGKFAARKNISKFNKSKNKK